MDWLKWTTAICAVLFIGGSIATLIALNQKVDLYQIGIWQHTFVRVFGTLTIVLLLALDARDIIRRRRKAPP
jgi:hypothetical protein